MTAVDLVTADLRRHEGLRLYPYYDTVGVLTIGYGRNLDDKGLTPAEAEYLLSNDVAEVVRQVYDQLPWVETLNDVRKAVLFNMAFNLGIAGLMKFKGTLAAIEAGEYDKAASRMLQSKWAGQVGRRATELADRMRNGT